MTPSDDAAPPAPDGVEIDRPSVARLYDWLLGGTHNYAIDREYGKQVLAEFPLFRPLARANRAWMNRVVRAAIHAGIRQFLDLGSGVPTVGNVHEVVRDTLPDGDRATVVYVDYEEVAAAHAHIMLEAEDADDWAGFVRRDMRDFRGVLRDPETKRLLDFSEPVCLLVVAALHFLGPDDAPGELMGQYCKRLAPGSWLAISHGAVDDLSSTAATTARNVVEGYRKTSNPVWARTRDEVEEFFGDWKLVDPGLVHVPDWRPDPRWTTTTADLIRPYLWCGVAENPLTDPEPGPA